MSGDISTFYPNDQNYCYSRQIYENSPLGRVIEAGMPGQTFAVGQQHTAQYAYTKNVNGDDFMDNLPADQYPMNKVKDQNGIWFWQMTSKAGQSIAKRSGPVSGYTEVENQVSVNYPDITTANFTPNLTHEAFWWAAPGAPMKSGESVDGTTSEDMTVTFKIGTTPGGYNIVNQTSNTRIEGSFTAQSGVTYYVTISAYAPHGDPAYASGSVTYYTWDIGDYYPTTSYQYDDYGNLITIYPPNYHNRPSISVDPNEFKTTMQYDFFGRIKQKDTPDGGVSRYIYDKAGRLRFSIDALGEAQTPDKISYWKYDWMGRTIEEGSYSYNWNEAGLQGYADTDPAWPATPATWRRKYYYDDAGSIITQRGNIYKIETNNDDDNTTEVEENFTYNFPGDVTTKSLKVIDYNSTTYTVSYEYDNLGNITRIVYPESAREVFYAYNRLGQTKTIGRAGNADFYAAYSYNADGSLNQEKLDDGAITRYFSYNSPGWLKQLTDSYFSEMIDYDTAGYGGAAYYNGNIARTVYDFTSGSHDNTYQYKYDNLNQLLVADNSYSASWDLGVGSGNEMKYDANGNILFMRFGTSAKNYAYYTGTNKVQNTDGSGNDYTYDANGNVKISTPKAITNIAYDYYTNMPLQVDNNLGWSKFEYDGGNARVFKEVDGETPYKMIYIHGLNDYPLMEKNTLSETILYIYGPAGLISTEKNGAVQYVIKDHLGSTRVVVNDNGTVAGSYNYLPLGGVSEVSGNGDNSYQYTGQERDDEVGLHNFRARLYDSELGKFYCCDPAGQGNSPYWFCGNNSIFYRDYDGRLFGWLGLLFADPITNASSIISGAILDGVRGAVHGALTGGNSIEEGAKSFKNHLKIWKGLINTDSDQAWYKQAWQIESRFTWELPQTSLGFGFAQFLNHHQMVDNVNYFHGATVLDNRIGGSGFMSISPYIYGENLKPDFRDHVFVHEYGHFLQSKRWGPGYLPLIGVPSLESALFFNYKVHDYRWFEADASYLGMTYFDKHYGSGREGYSAGDQGYFDKKSFITGAYSRYKNPRTGWYNYSENPINARLHWSDPWLYGWPFIFSYSYGH